MAAAIVLNPTHAPVGTSVLITGSGFALTSAITFTYGGSPITPTDGPITSDGTGAFTAHITIPVGVQGIHIVAATDASLGTASANFTVDPAITLTPSTQRIGGSTTVAGSGFATLSAVSITIGGVSVTGVTTDANGSFSQAETVPTLTEGSQTVSATDASTNNATATLTVSSVTLVRSPTHGPVGTVVTLTGANYIPSHQLTITNVDGTVSHVNSDSSGNIPAGTTVTIPAIAQGSHNITVGDGTNTGTVAFTVDSSLSLSPATGVVGATSAVTAKGLAANSAITISFAGTDVTPGGSPTSDANGSYTGTITVPSKPAGAETVTLTDASANAPTATYTVTPSISLDPTKGPQGAMTLVSGLGFANAGTITVTVDGVAVTTDPSPLTASSAGAFTGAEITIPALADGAHTVSATDGTNTASATFTVGTLLALTGYGKYAAVDGTPLTIADDAYIDQVVIDVRKHDKLSLQIYNNGSHGLTYSTYGIIHESDNIVPPTDDEGILAWNELDTDVAVLNSAQSVKQYTNILYSYILVQAKRTTSGQSTTALFAASATYK